MQISDGQQTGDGLLVFRKHAIGHSAVQQEGDNAPVNESGVALKYLTAIEASRHFAARINLKVQPRTEAAGRISKEAAGVLFTSQVSEPGLSIIRFVTHTFKNRSLAYFRR